MATKKCFKSAAFCAAQLFVFSLFTGAAGDLRQLTARPAPVKTGITPGSAAGSGVKAGGAASAAKAPAGGTGGAGYTEFDDFNNVSDPLYREGSKALLKIAIEDDGAPRAAGKENGVPAAARTAGERPRGPAFGGKPGLMRDAPSDTPAGSVRPVRMRPGGARTFPIFPAKKNRVKKLAPADPVKAKSTL
ncbi:MAG: hypothetical protein WCW52_11785 [Elusimicrobiales bacterium]|jgi:hypothetical protein